MAYKQSPGRMNMPKTGRGIDSVALMTGETSPLLKFPIKKGTKLKEGESILVKGPGGRTYKASSTEEALKKRGEFRKQGVKDVDVTGVTEVSKGEYSEQRKDPKTGSLRTEEQEVSKARSSANKKPIVKSSTATKLNKDYAETFSLKSTGEEGSSVGKAFDRVYNSKK